MSTIFGTFGSSVSDEDVVTLDTTQTITGEKTFTSNLNCDENIFAAEVDTPIVVVSDYIEFSDGTRQNTAPITITNYVTTNTVQTITAQKTFSAVTVQGGLTIKQGNQTPTSTITQVGGASIFTNNPLDGNTSFFLFKNTGVQGRPLILLSDQANMEGNVSFAPSAAFGYGEVRNYNAMPATNDATTIVPTTAWVQSAITASPNNYVSPFISFNTNWSNIPWVTPNMPGNATSTLFSLTVPNQTRRYRISTVWASLSFYLSNVNGATLQGVFRTNGQLQYINYFNMGCGMIQVTNNQDYQLTGGASAYGPIAGMSFYAGGTNSTQYSNQYSYEYVATLPANAVVTFEFTNSVATQFEVFYNISLYYD